MSLTKDDLRAAVGAGTISEAQAVRLISLAEARAGARDRVMEGDEPFEIFRGFNEIFVAVGLAILFVGYSFFFNHFGMADGLAGRTPAGFLRGFALRTMTISSVGLGAVVLLTYYFVFRRMMVAPSILLACAAGYFAGWLGGAVTLLVDGQNWIIPVFALLVLSAYWAWARVPFTLFLIAITALWLAVSMFSPEGEVPDFEFFFDLSADGPFALITILVGVVCFAVAMWFDQSDPHRVSRKTGHAFWLHVAAAPMIVNPVAATLFSMNAAGAEAALVGFIAALAVIALIIDRRSFLLSGIGYMIALIVTVIDGGFAVAMLGLGLILVTLGALWESIRGAILRGLPNFPGKSNLPPWV